jgi:hypothetical protein
MTILLRLAMSLGIGAIGGLVGYIATLAVIAWTEHCQPNGPACSLGGTTGFAIALAIGAAAGLGLGTLAWRRLGRFSARSATRTS